ncbi:MAG: DUF3362 domain-containing protein, partial [Methylocaldum sp.]|nr:DUF3362 domain-containing protein [Methylocaldum sp.]
DLIGNGKHHLVPTWQPEGTGNQHEGTRIARKALPFRTQHTGLPTTKTKTPRKSRRMSKS